MIYSHIPQCDDKLMIYFAPVFLTAFFFVSGYLYKSGQRFSYVLEQRIRTLLIPLFLLGILMIGMSKIISYKERVDILDSLKDLFIQSGFEHSPILWFVAALFVYSVFFYFVDRWCKTTLQFVMVIAVLFIVNCVTNYVLHIRFYWHLHSLGFGIFYMGLGRLYRQYEDQIDKNIKWWMVVICLLCYVAYIAYSQKYISCGGSETIIDAMILTLMGLVLIITISKKYLGGSKLLLFVGANSLFYFAFHGKVYAVIISIGNKVAPEQFSSDELFIKCIVALSVVLLDALILIPPAMFVNKYMPQMLGRKFKLWREG
ncbi:MAG: acyltransferase family protein [Clostridium sp.]|nr:acyltransferase family protein [Clostridium sp.]